MRSIREAREAFYASKPVCRGRFVPFEARDDGKSGVTFRGYASTTDDPYGVTDWLGEY